MIAPPGAQHQHPAWRHVVGEALLACLILICHAGVTVVILTCIEGVDRYRKWLQGPTPHDTLTSRIIDFAIHTAEGILVVALLLIGTVSAVWTFYKRMKG